MKALLKDAGANVLLLLTLSFTCKRGWRGPGPARAVTGAIDRCKRLLDLPRPS